MDLQTKTPLARLADYALPIAEGLNPDDAIGALVVPWAYDLWTVREDVDVFHRLALALRAWALYFPFVEAAGNAPEGDPKNAKQYAKAVANLRDPVVEAALLWVANTLGLHAHTLAYAALRVASLAQTEYGRERAAYFTALASMRPYTIDVEKTWQTLTQPATAARK